MKENCQVPLSKVKTIMKACPEAESISQDALVLSAKAAELFIVHLAKEAYKEDAGELNYDSLALLVQEKDQYDFLKDLLPLKKKLSECLAIIAKQAQNQTV